MNDAVIIEKGKHGKALRKPVLIVGLPGIGLVGQVAARYMIKKLDGKKVAEIYSPHFPHQVIMTKKGKLRMLKNVFYAVNLGKRDALVLIGDTQAITSEGQYDVAGRVLDYVGKKNVSEIITIGGYSTGKLEGAKKVFGATGSDAMRKKFEKAGVIFGEAKGSIVGAAGLLPALAKLRKMEGICIMGETHGSYVDPASAAEVLRRLSKVLGFKVSLVDLEKEAEEREKIIKKIESEIEKQVTKKKDITYIR